MVLPQEEEASGSYNHYRPVKQENVKVDRRNANNDANNGDNNDATSAARRYYEQYEDAARRRLFPDPSAPIGSQEDLGYQNEINLLIEAAEERAKKYWNFAYEYDDDVYNFLHSMPGDPLNVQWQLEGMLPPEHQTPPKEGQIGLMRPYPY